VALFRPVYWTAKLPTGVVAALGLFLVGTMVEFVVGITAALGFIAKESRYEDTDILFRPYGRERVMKPHLQCCPSLFPFGTGTWRTAR